MFKPLRYFSRRPVIRLVSVSSIKRVLSSWGLLFLAAHIFWAVTVSPVLAQDTSKSPLVVMGDKDYPPYESLVDGEPAGINVDLWREIAKILGRPLDLRLYQWADAQARVQRGEAKVLTFMSFNKERDKLYDFTKPTFTSRFPVFVDVGLVDQFDISDLTGKRIAVKKGGFPRTIIETIHPEAEMVFVDSALQGFRKLLRGEVDGVMEDERVGNTILRQNDFQGIRATPKALAVKTGHIAVAKGNPALLRQIDEALGALKASGKFDQIADKWADWDTVLIKKETIRFVIVWGLAAIILILGLGGMVYVLKVRKSNLALKKEITERKQAEKALRESEEYLKIIIDTVPAIITVKDKESRYLITNRYHKEMFGHTKDELLGKTSSFYSSEHGKKMKDLEQKIIETGEVLPFFDYKLIDTEGHNCDVLVTKAPLKDLSGEIIGTVTAAIDITERKRAEEARLEIESRFRAVVDASPAPITLKDRDGCYLLVNKAFAEWMDIDAAKIAGRTIYDFLPEAQAANVEEEDHHLMETGEMTVEEAIRSFPDGHERTVLVNRCPIRSTDGSINSIATILTDITYRKEAEVSLRESEEKYRNLFDNAAEGIVKTTVTGHFIEANSAFARMLAYTSADELISEVTNIGQQIWVNSEDRQAMLAQLDTDGAVRMETSMHRKDGETIWVSIAVTGVRDEVGALVGLESIVQDITYRKKAEEALRESEERLRRAVIDAPIPIMIHAEDGEVLMISQQWTDLTGYTHTEIPTILDWTEKAYGKDGIIEESRERIETLYDIEEKTGEGEYYITTKSGESRTWDFRSSPLGNLPDGRSLVISMAIDITERKQAEIELRDRDEQLRQAQKMEAVGQLTGGVAHDFNNLLAVINGNLELVMDTGGLEDGTRDMLHRAMAAVDKGATLTDQLLTFSRQQILNPKIGNANALIADMTRLLVRTLGEDIEIRTAFAEDLPSINVDPGLLGNAILNLANNARDAMPRGGVLLIETSEVELDGEFLKDDGVGASGPHVVITVSDAGSGMDEETLNHVFEPFYTTKGVGEGTGLGLSMVYGFVKQSGGYVTIDSEKGEGTTIRLYFPVAEEQPEDTEEMAPSPKAEAKGKETILVVEDDVDVREVTMAMLNRLGYKVLEAEDGPSALKILKKDGDGVDMVFSDVIMPSGMSGYDLANELRRHYQGIKVLMTSGYPEKIIDKGGTGITLLRKPYKKATLAEAVRGVLDR